MFAGGKPNSGKTAVAIHCAIQASLPKQFGGSEADVIWVACNGLPDVKLMTELLRARCSPGSVHEESAASQCVRDEAVNSSLARLKFFECNCAFDFFLAVRKVYSMCGQRRKSSNLGAVVLDPVSFHWHCDKYTTQKKFLRMAFNLLLVAQKKFQFVIVAVRASFQKRSSDYWFLSENGEDVCVHFPVIDSASSNHHGMYYRHFDNHVTHRVSLSSYCASKSETLVAVLSPLQLVSRGHDHTFLRINFDGSVVS